jgi:transcriptional regulator with XRE-family HTH domain
MTLAPPNRIRELRRRQGLSLRRLALLSGLGRNTIHRLETGAHRPTERSARLLAAALGVSVAYLLGATLEPGDAPVLETPQPPPGLRHYPGGEGLLRSLSRLPEDDLELVHRIADRLTRP